MNQWEKDWDRLIRLQDESPCDDCIMVDGEHEFACQTRWED